MPDSVKKFGQKLNKQAHKLVDKIMHPDLENNDGGEETAPVPKKSAVPAKPSATPVKKSSAAKSSVAPAKHAPPAKKKVPRVVNDDEEEEEA